MTKSPLIAMGLFIASLTALVASASAQTVPGNEWSQGTTLGLSAGSAAASDTHGTVGAALGWEVNHWVELEGTGAWLVARHGEQAFAAELKVVTSLTRPNTVVPFVGAGLGMYRATFDPTAGVLPNFYQRRLTESPAGTRQVFSDPWFVFATGLDVFANRHFSFRPELSVRLVTRASETYAVTMASVRVTYHFELHERGR